MAAADATDDGGILKGLFELKGEKNNKIKKQTQKEREGGRKRGEEIVVKYWSKNGISKLLMRVK